MDPCRSPERFWCCADAKTQDLVGIYGVRKTLFLSPSFPSTFFPPIHPFFTPLPLHHNTLSQSALISPDNIMYCINKYIYIYICIACEERSSTSQIPTVFREKFRANVSCLAPRASYHTEIYKSIYSVGIQLSRTDLSVGGKPTHGVKRIAQKAAKKFSPNKYVYCPTACMYSPLQTSPQVLEKR